VGIVCADLAFSQNEVDALRYSQLNFGGTARFMGTAGAFGALGADFSTLSFNPAGIAMYRKSEFTVSPGLFMQKTSSSYLGTGGEDSRFNLMLGNCGVVFAYHNGDSDNNPEWKGVALGIGYNRTNNFYNRIMISGKNNDNSMIDIFVNDANNTSYDPNDLDQFSTQLAWNTWLIDTAGGTYYGVNSVYGETQTKSIETSGSMGETVLSFGGNYANKLYLGCTFGFPNLVYRENSTYQEEFNDTTSGLKNFVYNQELTTRGSGFNFKFGLIYKPVEWVRIGGALHTPTLFRLTDDWSSRMTSDFTGVSYTSDSPIGNYDYTLTTPMRAIGSIAFVIGKMGFVSADYEFVDYGTAHLSSPLYVFLDENSAISKGYTVANNIRVGGELKLAPIALRAGFAMYGSPYRTGSDGARTSITGGFGFREDNFFIDFAYIYSMMSEKYYLYDPALATASKNDMKSSQYVMTLGFRF
jgi:hypothetical protein